MSLAHAILGILRDGAMTGYDLKTRSFDRSLAHFWPADQAQIYRTLDRLHRQGWVDVRVEEQVERPAKKIYAITPAGKQELERWIRDERFPPPVVREPSLIQIFFADRQDPKVVRDIIQGIQSQHQERLATYAAVPLPPLGADAPRDKVLQRMTLEMGIRHSEAMVAWAEACLEHVGAEHKEARGRHRRPLR